MDLQAKSITLFDSNGNGDGEHHKRLETIVNYLESEWEKGTRNGMTWNKMEWELKCARVGNTWCI